MIEKVVIKNLKGIVNKSISFRNLSVVVGQNNVGKTTILQSIIFVQELMKYSIVKSRKQETKYDVKNQMLSLKDIHKLPLSDTSSFWYNNRNSRDNSMEITIHFVNQGKLDLTLFKPRDSDLITFWCTSKNLSDNDLELFLNTNYALHIPSLTHIPLNELYIGEYARMARIIEGKQHSIIRNIVYSLSKKPDDFDLLVNSLREFYQEFNNLHVEYDEQNQEYLNVKYSKIGSGEHFDIINMGTGFLQVLQVLAYTLEYKPRVLLLDEPDVHLHPDNKILLLNELKNLSESLDIQIILTTHSRDILINADQENIIWVNTDDEILPGAKKGEMVQAFIDLGGLSELDELRLRPNIAHVLVEDKKSIFWKMLFKLKLGENWNKKVLLSSFKGKSNKKALFLLSEFHSNFFNDSKILCVTDKDFDTDEEINNFCEEAKKFHIKPFVIPVHEVENYLITSAVLCKTINDLLDERTVEQEEVNNLIRAAVVETKDENIQKHAFHLKDLKNIELSKAIELAELEYENIISDFNKTVLWVRGKPLLKKIRKSVQDKYKITLSDTKLCKGFNSIELPEEINSVLDWVKS
ncbi:ATP-binding protein [Alkalihalobacillus macyae]|uniref:AAA family ATPase n=1 Tax=Guptibacillus hwajinpoensis TaxID=208199 RepID=UPI00273C25B0|nr:ATP-binding protein [Alkalihalobacillus macyae]MDP4553416.1 ATP-binding protein [Alkalihalobacillus macyae]